MRSTDEQRAFRRRLTELVSPVLPQARITADAEGFPIVPGRLGRIEYLGMRHGPDRDGGVYRERLHVFTDRPRIIAKLLAVPGIQRRQMGDTEARLAWWPEDTEALRAVAKIIRVRVRRSLPAVLARVNAARRDSDPIRSFTSSQVWTA